MSKEKKKNKCDCSGECTCGDDCHCTKDNKCNENCTCGDECHCNENCDCSGECTCKNCKCKQKAEKIEKEFEELKTKSNQILATASYYKNEAETTKKDFERYKERNKNIESELEQKVNEEAVKKMLPIIDNFSQAMAAVDEVTKKGFEMIYNSMLEMLASFGAVEIEAEGDLDPEIHNCITTETTENEELDGKIATVFQKGYKITKTNKVVRPSTVSVYKK